MTIHVARDLKLVPIESLKPYEKNARTHSDEQIAQIAASMKEWGFTNPILIDGEQGIIAGHGRLAAAKSIGLKEVPVVELSHLTPTQKRAYILADNKLALNAGWDAELLASEIAALKDEEFDLDLLGFTDEELADLDFEEEKLPPGEEDEVPEARAEPKVVRGEVYILGRHRLMCGDSTAITDVERLMGGAKTDMVFTDPPYNVAFNGRSGKHDVIKNDDLEEEDFERFIEEVCQTIALIAAPVHYVWCNWAFYGVLQGKLPYKACIVWAKNVFGMGVGYRHQHEFCLFNGTVDDHIKNESDLWQVKKDTQYMHPTQKPVELSERALGNHKSAKNILDLFGGSGSTLIGCEKAKRNAFLMELDPIYCGVILDRWEKFTGKQANREDGKPWNEIKNAVS